MCSDSKTQTRFLRVVSLETSETKITIRAYEFNYRDYLHHKMIAFVKDPSIVRINISVRLLIRQQKLQPQGLIATLGYRTLHF